MTSSEVKDPAIKLFGTTISFPLSSSSATDQEASRKELTLEQDGSASHQTSEDLKSQTSSGAFEDPKTPSPSAERETSSLKPSKDGEQSETSTSPQEKTLKKPDKILPCPRCNSMDTKFCYYNNYNVNQPRHFCKNCQRYWTAGGTMRNVPVGAGRRKNKSSSSSHYRHIMVPESLLLAKANAANGLHNAGLGNGATVLTFGSDSPPICDSMASVLNLAEKTQNGVANGFHHVPEQNIFVSYGREENRDDPSMGASVTTSTSSEKRANDGSSQESVDKSYEALRPQLQCIPGSPWHYPWNSMQWSTPVPPPSAFCPPGYPVSFYPNPTYWGCTLPASWNIPCISPQYSVTVNQSSPSSGSNSPTLGKHSRDGSIILTPSNSEKEKTDHIESKTSENGVLTPKTLRIDDPSEAAKSSIWSTLGIKNEKANGGLFKSFPSKGEEKNHHRRSMVEASPALQANPAALSRSLTFHEQQT